MTVRTYVRHRQFSGDDTLNVEKWINRTIKIEENLGVEFHDLKLSTSNIDSDVILIFKEVLADDTEED